MMSDEDFDRAVKSAAQEAVRENIDFTGIWSFAYAKARALCPNDGLCMNSLAASIIDHHAYLVLGPKWKAMDGEPVLFRTDYDGEPVALLLARPGPLQPLDMAAYSERYGFFDMDLAASHDETTPATPEGATRLRALLREKGIRFHEVEESTAEMDAIRHARASGALADELES
jgi:hypothetical protein